MRDELPARIALDEALVAFLRHLRYPAVLFEEMRRDLGPSRAGIMWFSDHALMVYQENGESWVERAGFEAILGKVKPIDWALLKGRDVHGEEGDG